MRAGPLFNEGKIQSNAPTRDAIGGEVAAWSDFVASWWFSLAHVEQIRVEKKLDQKTVHTRADWRATGRYVSGVTAKMRLTFSGRTFDILNAYDPDGNLRELRLDLLERNV